MNRKLLPSSDYYKSPFVLDTDLQKVFQFHFCIRGDDTYFKKFSILHVRV